MDYVVYIIGTVLILGLAVWGLDRYLILKDLEIDLREYAASLQAAKDLYPEDLRVHVGAQICIVDMLLRKYFDED